MANILVVDDEYEVCTFFYRLLQRKGYTVKVSTSGNEAVEYIDTTEFYVALIDLKLPDTDGLELLSRLRTAQPFCEVIIMTGYSTTRTAVKAIQMGAFDYIEKPFDNIEQIEELILKAINFGSYGVESEKNQPEWFDIASQLGLQVGNNQKMRQLVEIAYKIAKKNINVLIQGETGTGKEVLARYLHACSDRSEKTFIPINCGAFQENLLESELFGHEKGAFTGASGRHRGIFEVANEGTLFLDEIGEASLSIQVKLLRVLESGEFIRVGGEKAITTDVRVIAATNVDLQKAVEEKKFREDLFYRLDVVRLEIPPLRERKEDIPMLVNYLLNNSTNNSSIQVSPEAMQILSEYSWPGNIRELINTLNRAVALMEGDVILPSNLSYKILNEVRKAGDNTSDVVGIPAGGDRRNYRSIVYRLEEMLRRPEYLDELPEDSILSAYKLIKQMEENIKENINRRGIPAPPPPSLGDIEREVIIETINYYQGNISSAARSLGIGRNTLYRKLKEYGISYK